MPLKVSQRGAIPPFIVMDVMQAAAEREAEKKAVYHLEVGQPGTPAPKGVLDAARRALDENRLGYTVAPGILEWRKAIAAHYLRNYSVVVDEHVFLLLRARRQVSLCHFWRLSIQAIEWRWQLLDTLVIGIFSRLLELTRHYC